ncbi:hypothetical protein BCL76_111124 [Streptomyces sp. CG 926]|uniref:hypothetical protein n=1 Tax=Streptomyces sp. CG 926 TaxID=1882405 RepID=UPI000D7A8A62|nr:hypothetical protein [Streptomyces sp. CG 926]PWK66073.1 hypothetical protein BCL76_111124 [Streptomyces sp. CG 926]
MSLIDVGTPGNGRIVLVPHINPRPTGSAWAIGALTTALGSVIAVVWPADAATPVRSMTTDADAVTWAADAPASPYDLALRIAVVALVAAGATFVRLHRVHRP